MTNHPTNHLPPCPALTEDQRDKPKFISTSPSPPRRRRTSSNPRYTSPSTRRPQNTHMFLAQEEPNRNHDAPHQPSPSPDKSEPGAGGEVISRLPRQPPCSNRTTEMDTNEPVHTKMPSHARTDLVVACTYTLFRRRKARMTREREKKLKLSFWQLK